MIVTKQESMASLIHDTSPNYDIVCTCPFYANYPYIPFLISKNFNLLVSFHFFTAFSSESYRT